MAKIGNSRARVTIESLPLNYSMLFLRDFPTCNLIYRVNWAMLTLLCDPQKVVDACLGLVCSNTSMGCIKRPPSAKYSNL